MADDDVEFREVFRSIRSLVTEYACHTHWRCEHQDRWPWEGDCMCGLVKALRDAGFEDDIAINAPVAR